MSEQKPSIILICDSRGKLLQKEFNDPKYLVSVKTYSGAKLYQATKLAEKSIEKTGPGQIYVLAGINTITHLNRQTRQVTLMSPDKGKILQQFTDELNFSFSLLRKASKMNARIVYAPITGMSLATYNRLRPESCRLSQELLNEVLLEINNLIIAFNKSHECKTPWTHGIVHRYYKGKYHFMYERLDDDGCHLTNEIRAYWGRKLYTAIAANNI